MHNLTIYSVKKVLGYSPGTTLLPKCGYGHVLPEGSAGYTGYVWVDFRSTPPPVIVTIRDNGAYIMVLLYS